MGYSYTIGINTMCFAARLRMQRTSSFELTGGDIVSTEGPKTNANDVICLVGLATFCAMLRPPFFGTLINDGIASFATLRFAYDASLVLFGAALFFGFERKPDACVGKMKALAPAASGAAMLVGICLVNGLRHLGSPNGSLFALGVLLISLGLAGLATEWFSRLSDYPRQRIPVVALQAFVVSHVFGIVDALPREIAANASIIYPILSAGALIIPKRKDAAQPAGVADSYPVIPSPYFKKIRAFALVLVLVEVFCGCLLRSRWAHGGVSYDPTLNTVITYVVSAAIGLVFLLVASRSKSAAEGSLIIGALGMIGFTPATFLFSQSPVSVLAPFVTGLYSALLVFMMALLVLWNTDGDTSSVTASGAFLMLYGAVTGVTTSVIPTALSYQGIMPDEHLALLGVLAGLVISLGVAAALFLMVVVHRDSYHAALEHAGINHGTSNTLTSTQPKDDSFSHEASGVPARNPEEGWELVLEKVALKYGLTERERQTASLIAQGYSVKRVAEQLGVVPGTVQGYSKRIYLKMGVHKRDELIEIVNQFRDSL